MLRELPSFHEVPPEVREEDFWDLFENFLAEFSEGDHTARDVLLRWPESAQGHGATSTVRQFVDRFMNWMLRVGLVGPVGTVVPDIRAYYVEDADVQVLEAAVTELRDQSAMAE